MGDLFSELSSAETLETEDEPKSNVNVKEYYRNQALTKKYYTEQKQEEFVPLKRQISEKEIFYRIQTDIKLEYITSRSISIDIFAHNCSYGHKGSEMDINLNSQKYHDFHHEAIPYIHSNQQQLIINILINYTDHITSNEIVSYLHHSDKSAMYHAICHSNNIKKDKNHYKFQSICPYFLKSKIAIFRNYYKALSPILNIAVVGAKKIGKSSFCLRWEQNKFTPSYIVSKNRDFYQKELILEENESKFITIKNDFGFSYSFDDDQKNENDMDLQSLSVDISKVFVRMYDINDDMDISCISEKNIDVLFVCFAIDDKKSFQYLQNYLLDKDEKDKGILKVVIGLRSEMKNDRFYKFNPNYLISSSRIVKLSEEYKIPYFEVSAKTGRNVQFVVIQSLYECWLRCCKIQNR